MDNNNIKNEEKFMAELDTAAMIEKLQKEQQEAQREFQNAMGQMMNTVLTNFLKIVCPIMDEYLSTYFTSKTETVPNLYDYIANQINNNNPKGEEK